MRLKAFLTGAAFFFIATGAQAQYDSLEILQVRLAPLNLADPWTGVIQVGVQKRFTERIAASLDYGLRCRVASRYRNQEREDYRYYKAKAELKYYLFLRRYNYTNFSHPYLAMQAFYFPQHYRKYNDWLVTPGKDYRYEYSDIDRIVSVASLLAGGEVVRDQMVLDFYFGGGVRRINIRHHMTGAVESFYSEPADWGGAFLDRWEGITYRPHLVLGFKVGYSFRK